MPFVHALLEKGEVEGVTDHRCTCSFFSCLFLVLMSVGSKRPILDLEALNFFVRKKIIDGDYLFSLASLLDMIDAFLHVMLTVTSRWYVRFQVNSCCVFKSYVEHVCYPVVCYLRAQSIHIYTCMDDWLLRYKAQMNKIKCFSLF